jgi:phosphoadenosine phosphosulfate reductase
MLEQCRQDESITYLHPIIEWTESEIWEYIKGHKIPYCSLYDEGFKRLGCIMCPMSDTKGMLRAAERWPKYYRAYLRAFEKMVANGKCTTWKTAQDVMDWWIYNPPKGDPDQTVMFE